MNTANYFRGCEGVDLMFTNRRGALEQIDAPARKPVILPMRPSADYASELLAHEPPGGLRHFAIPELCSTPAELFERPAPTAVWPTCERPETVRACAQTAEAIYRRVDSNRSAILALTSPDDGDGKTDLMLGLAPELAKLAGDTLAVDADYAKPDLSLRLILPICDASTGIYSLIYPTNRTDLNVLPHWSGGSASNWSREWFEDLRDRWNLVLFDAPSLERAEPSPLMRYCDGVYLVVRLGYTPRRAAAESARAIHARGSRMLGSIVIG
ncbi:MAG: CpsD/CapB family tyrosine-protein kinase [Pirellulaceae bacterium]|nr:CpsD/CapB family tyrosine-protein kinase [Pirellulaceae bacterium]